MRTKNFTYREMTLSSAQVEVPRETYQRSFNAQRARKIADEFDERTGCRMTVPPRASCRRIFTKWS